MKLSVSLTWSSPRQPAIAPPQRRYPGAIAFFAALLLGVVNAIVRPIVVLLTLPVTLVTLGLFLLVVNAAMLGLVAAFLPGFSIAGFWPAVWAALLISLVSWLGSALFKKD